MIKKYATLIIIVIALVVFIMYKPTRGKNSADIKIYSYGEEYYEGLEDIEKDFNTRPIYKEMDVTYRNIYDFDSFESLLSFVYSVDDTAYVKHSDLDLHRLLNIDLQLDLTHTDDPQILILHTHSQERYKDSNPEELKDTIVGIGALLADILSKEYNVSVVHDYGVYDMINGNRDTSSSYELMARSVSKILDKYPSIQVIVDLHRDFGVLDSTKVNINGKDMAKLMFFNGITRVNDNGDEIQLKDLKNPYLQENLAFSLKMYLTANEYYEGIMRKIYIKSHRYGMHMKPLSLLVEVGSDENTVQEANNSMYPLADILFKVLNKD